MKIKYDILALVLTILVFSNHLFSQNKAYLDPDSYNPGYLSSLLLKDLNEFRSQQNLDYFESNKLFEMIANDQAYYMAEHSDLTLKNKGKKKTTIKRARFYGATKNVYEIVVKSRVSRGRTQYTYQEVADLLMASILKKKKYVEILKNAKYVFVGISPIIDYEGKYVYTSLIFGNYSSFNTGAKKREFLSHPYTTKTYGLKNAEYRTCRKCNKFDDWEGVQQALYVDNGAIFLRYKSEYRSFKRMLRNKKDGLTVDIIQKSQYQCGSADNIVDYDLPNKGIMLKPLYSKKIFANNLDKSRRPKELYIKLGDLPEGIDQNYELNLIMIQDKHVCKTVFQSYNEIGESDLFQPLQLVPDTVSIKTKTIYFPVPDTTYLDFTIPFEQGKYTYDPKDIKPFIEALQEPDFTILEVELIAVSSIEGSDKINEELQKKRAESIINAMKKLQSESIISSVSTNNGWELFRSDIMDTRYSKMADMTFDEARKYMIEKNLTKELEPILAKHRFAAVDLRVVYDIAGEKEQFFVVNKFNKTLEQKDIPFAFAMQKFVIDKAVAHVYKNKALEGMEIPDKAQNAPLLVNKLFLEHISNDNKLDPDFCQKMQALYEQAPDNDYIHFNKMCCDVKNKIFTNPQIIKDFQYQIQEFYEKDIPKDYVDNLNLNLQFKVIKYTDTLDEPTKTAIQAFERIKKIVKIDETNQQSCLELAKLFIKYNDYQFAGRLLDRFINEDDLDEEYVFTYLSVCSHIYAKIMSRNFVNAMKRAAKLNPDRFCKLFDGTAFSFQIFDNPLVKEVYCDLCKKN